MCIHFQWKTSGLQTFLKAWKGLEEKLEEGLAFLGKPPAPLLLALVHLASATPFNIVSSVKADLLQWLLPALPTLIESALADAEGLQGALTILMTALQEPGGMCQFNCSEFTVLDIARNTISSYIKGHSTGLQLCKSACQRLHMDCKSEVCLSTIPFQGKQSWRARQRSLCLHLHQPSISEQTSVSGLQP